MINAAKNWTLVSKQIECTESGTDTRSNQFKQNVIKMSCLCFWFLCFQICHPFYDYQLYIFKLLNLQFLSLPPYFSLTIGASREVVSNINTTLCGDKIERLEHVEAHITFECTRRGEVELFLTSAQGTQSKLLTKRRKDISSATSFSWKFMSVHYWGETPSGIWSLKMRVKDASLAGAYPSFFRQLNK